MRSKAKNHHQQQQRHRQYVRKINKRAMVATTENRRGIEERRPKGKLFREYQSKKECEAKSKKNAKDEPVTSD